MATVTKPYISIAGVTLPAHLVVLPVSITVGRDDPTAQPDANTMSFEYWSEVLPAHFHRGASATMWLSVSGGEGEDGPDLWEDIWDPEWTGNVPEEGTGQKRFTGMVSDLSVRPDPANGRIYTKVTCIGTLTGLAEQIVGDEPWPEETDYARVARLDAVIRPNLLFDNDGATDLVLRPRDVDRRKVLELLHAFGGSVGSVVWEHPDGSIHYERWDKRDVPLPGSYLSLPAESIVADVEWSQSSDQLIDRVRVEYGPEPQEGNRTEVVVGAGVHETRFSGEAGNLATATAIANVVLARWSRTDMWDAPLVTVRSDLIDQPTYDALLAILPSDPLGTGHLTLWPSDGTVGDGLWFIEGWTETYDRTGPNAPLLHTWELNVSDVRRFAVAGEDIADLTLTLSPTSYGMAYTRWSINVRRASGAPLPLSGFITITVDGMMFGYPVNLATDTGNGYEVAWSPLMTEVEPGVHTVLATYSGYPGEYRPAVSNSAPLTVTDTGYTHITLISPTTVPHVGEDLHLVAHLFSVAEGVPEGRVVFDYSTDSGATWHTYVEVDAGGGDEGATVTAVWRVPRWGLHFWRATFYKDPEEPRWTDTGSNWISVWPAERQPQEKVYYASWSRTYTGSGGGLSADFVSQGDWGEGYGDRRGLIGFPDLTTEWDGYYITKAEVYLFASEFQNTTGGTIRLGSHPYAAAPLSGVTNDTITPRADVSQWPVMTGKWIDVTGWARRFTTGEVRGIAVGPAERPGSTVVQATVHGTVPPPSGQHNVPMLAVTGYKWVPVR